MKLDRQSHTDFQVLFIEHMEWCSKTLNVIMPFESTEQQDSYYSDKLKDLETRLKKAGFKLEKK